MPRWISEFGKWVPAPEYAVDDRAPEGQEIYRGPDRAAILELRAQGVEFLGKDFHLDPDTIRAARTLGYKTVDEYLTEMFGFNKKEQAEKFETLKKETGKEKTMHKNAPRKAAIKEMGGGYDTTGNSETEYGDFGKPKNAPTIAAKMKE